MVHIRIAILAYFFTGTLNWQVLWGKEKCLLNLPFYEKLKNKISLKEMLTVKNLFFPGTNKLIKGQIYSSKFLNSIKLEELEKSLKLENHREKMSMCQCMHV